MVNLNKSQLISYYSSTSSIARSSRSATCNRSASWTVLVHTPLLVLGALKSKLEQPVQVLEQVVQGMSVFLLTTNMRLFLNPIINDIFSPILICEKPFL